MATSFICTNVGNAEIVEKKSRFIANVVPINSEEDALLYLAKIKKEYWDARHNCYAYITFDQSIKRCSDDGEPSGTAGKPMLEVLQNRNIYGICVVVTRYFGGILLGTGGLLRAYQEATIKGIENAGIAELRLGYKTSWSINYDEYGKFNFLCEKLGVYKIDTQYLDKIKILLVIPISEFETFKFKVLEESSGKIKPTEMEKVNFVLIDKKVVLV
jgi:hypothetical protein